MLFRGLLQGLAPDSRMVTFLLGWQQVSTMWIWQQALRHFLKLVSKRTQAYPFKTPNCMLIILRKTSVNIWCTSRANLVVTNMCEPVPGACGCEDFHRWRLCDLWKPLNPEARFPTLWKWGNQRLPLSAAVRFQWSDKGENLGWLAPAHRW